MQPPELSQIGPYRVVRLVDEGGMAWVFEVVDPKFGVRRALKMLKPGTQDVRFSAEARLLSQIDHPNVVTIFDWGQDEDTGYHYYTMNYIDGKSLAALLPLSIGQAGPIFVQALSGLAQLHKADIIHRDIKPSNIMLTLDDRALLCDLGIARRASAESGLTQAGTALGTCRYMSPEQAQAGETGFTCDIFSMGLTLFEVLAGHTFYDAAGLPNNNEAILFYLAKRVATGSELEFVFPDVMDPLARKVITTACRIQPDERYADGERMHAAWKNAVDRYNQNQATAELTVAMPAHSVGWRKPASFAAVGLVVLAMAAIFFVRDPAVPVTVPNTKGSPSAISDADEGQSEILESPAREDRFDRVLQLLRDRAAPWQSAQARVQAIPQSVRLDHAYKVSFSAECRCWALLFAVDQAEGEIWLLYPNQLEPPRELSPGQPISIPSPGGGMELRAEGTERKDTLLLMVFPDQVQFPPEGFGLDVLWSATEKRPDRITELEEFLQGLEGKQWAKAATDLQISE